jgi:hypothetical protein
MWMTLMAVFSHSGDPPPLDEVQLLVDENSLSATVGRFSNRGLSMQFRVMDCEFEHDGLTAATSVFRSESEDACWKFIFEAATSASTAWARDQACAYDVWAFESDEKSDNHPIRADLNAPIPAAIRTSTVPEWFRQQMPQTRAELMADLG